MVLCVGRNVTGLGGWIKGVEEFRRVISRRVGHRPTDLIPLEDRGHYESWKTAARKRFESRTDTQFELDKLVVKDWLNESYPGN